MDMVKVKTAELTGAALDWAVAKVLGFTVKKSAFETDYWHSEDFGPCWYNGPVEDYRPSTDWSQGGPLIELHISDLQRDVEDYSEPDMPWYAECGVFWDIGQTPLIAACRAIVAAKLGREVEVPQELISSQA